MASHVERPANTHPQAYFWRASATDEVDDVADSKCNLDGRGALD